MVLIELKQYLGFRSFHNIVKILFSCDFPCKKGALKEHVYKLVFIDADPLIDGSAVNPRFGVQSIQHKTALLRGREAFRTHCGISRG